MRAVFSVCTLLIGVAIILAGNGLLGSLLGVRATTEQFSTLITGVKAREIHFHTEEEMAVMTDGEVLHVVPRRVEVLRQAVEICV